MNACTSPRDIVPWATRNAADDGDRDVVEVADEGSSTGMMMPGDELRLEARLVELLVLLVEVAIGSSWRPNTFTMLWPVCISSTWPLSVPVLPLRGELLLRAPGDQHRHDGRQRDARAAR